jgi:hypothetical protein
MEITHMIFALTSSDCLSRKTRCAANKPVMEVISKKYMKEITQEESDMFDVVIETISQDKIFMCN